MKLEDINPDDVDEISSIKIDRRKSSNERILDFLIQVKNPYVFKVNGKLVRMSFSENAPTADECLTRVLENLYNMLIVEVGIKLDKEFEYYDNLLKK